MKRITDFSQLDLNAAYTYGDYLLWQFSERVELIKGSIFKMSPAPNRKHQQISLNLSVLLYQSIKNCGQKCKIYTAPFDVRLLKSAKKTANKDIFTVVQPDMCIVCDPEKLDEQGCIGAPDLIVEILSKGNSKKEMKIKYELYEENGVREYWVIFPYEEVLQQFVLNENGKYELHQIYSEDEKVQSVIFPNLEINLELIFEE